MLADRFLAPVRRRPRLPLPLSVLAVWLLAALAAPAVLASGTAAPVALFVLLPPLVFLVLLATSARVQRFVAGLDLRLLTLAQSGRVVGAALLVLLAVGTLPAGFALPAGVGDVLIGLSAPLIATLVVPRLPAYRGVYLAWTALGILDLVIAATTGVLNSPTSLGVLAGATTTQAMARLPLSLFPTFLVPLALIMHLQALTIVSGSAARRAAATA